MNTCVVYFKQTMLSFQWKGPGSEKPIKPDGARNEFKNMHYKPLKVMDAFICGLCRITQLPRLTLLTQWDLRGTSMETGDCTFQWVGEFLNYCNNLLLQLSNGRVLRFLDLLKAFQLSPHNERRLKRSVANVIPQRHGGGESSRHPHANRITATPGLGNPRLRWLLHYGRSGKWSENPTRGDGTSYMVI